MLRDISARMIDRYSTRYRDMGYHVRTLGWGTSEQQRHRFAQTMATGLSFEGKAVLDIGCGFGDYVAFLAESGVGFASYLGLDINPDLIGEAHQRHQGRPERDFRVLDLCVGDLPNEPLGDVGVMLGLLNLDLQGEMDNYDYSCNMIANALSLVREALVVDFISARRVEEYPKEDFIFYHEPMRMLDFAFTLSDSVMLKHDYMPIPQKEFMLVLKR